MLKTEINGGKVINLKFALGDFLKKQVCKKVYLKDFEGPAGITTSNSS